MMGMAKNSARRGVVPCEGTVKRKGGIKRRAGLRCWGQGVGFAALLHRLDEDEDGLVSVELDALADDVLELRHRQVRRHKVPAEDREGGVGGRGKEEGDERFESRGRERGRERWNK